MGLLTKEVVVIPAGVTIKYYREKGYDAKYHVPLTVKVEDLLPCSTALVETQCDYCGKKRQPIKYVDYNAQTKNGTEKCCCTDCAKLKRDETMIKRYGERVPLHIKKFRDKQKETNNRKYGSNSPTGDKKIKEKQVNTLMKNYGVTNPSLSKEIQEKRKNTFIERFGVENPFLDKEIRDNATKTIIERYGVDNVLLNQDIRNKRNETLIKRYGTLFPLQNEKCLEKLKQTNKNRYNVEYISQLEETKEKVKQTNLQRYGVETPLQNEAIKEKIRRTNLQKYGTECLLSLPSFHEHSREVDMERYGVYHHLQNPEILAKQKETFFKNSTCPTSKQQDYLYKLYGGELNYPFKMYNLDIYLPNDNIDIEYDGSGHKMGISIGCITQEEFNRKEIIRNNAIKKEGIKQMRIISTTDKLPSDDKLIEMLEFAKNYFISYPKHSWIEFNIDTSIVRNAEHKNGEKYSFGKLRYIKK